jgi:hypothetical protein
MKEGLLCLPSRALAVATARRRAANTRRLIVSPLRLGLLDGTKVARKGNARERKGQLVGQKSVVSWTLRRERQVVRVLQEGPTGEPELELERDRFFVRRGADGVKFARRRGGRPSARS